MESGLIEKDPESESKLCSSCSAWLLCCGGWEWQTGLTSVQGPQAEVGLPVELFYTCWPRGGVENVPLLVPGSLVVCCQLTLHVQVRHRCWRETDRVRQQLKHVRTDRSYRTEFWWQENSENIQSVAASHQHPRKVFIWNPELFSIFFNPSVLLNTYFYSLPQPICFSSDTL